jgi:hypothetical protein
MLVFGLVVAHLGSLAAIAADETETEDMKCLFDGTDLSEWQMSDNAAWTVKDGVITLEDRTDGKLNNADYLWTKQQYGNFVLELEFKVCEGYCNSGIFLRTSDLEDPVYTGLEIQVSNSHDRPQITRGGTAGAVYDCQAPTKNMVFPPGEWNHYRITCNDNMVTVELNGEQVTRMDLDQWTQTGKNPDGSSNKFKKPLKDFSRIGYIGLQDHGRPVWYRNIRVARLP